MSSVLNTGCTLFISGVLRPQKNHSNSSFKAGKTAQPGTKRTIRKPKFNLRKPEFLARM